MAAPKGHEKYGGRKKGTPNKLTTSAREAFAFAFDRIGGSQGLAEWAMENKQEFYKLYARLIPIEHTGEGGGPIKFTSIEIKGIAAK